MQPILDREILRSARRRPRISIILVLLLILLTASFALAFDVETAFPRIPSVAAVTDAVTIDTATVLGPFVERIQELVAGLSLSRAKPASNPPPGDEPPSPLAPPAAPPVEVRPLLIAAADVAADIQRRAADVSQRISVAAAAAFDAPANFSSFLRSLFSRFFPDPDLVYVAPQEPDQSSGATQAATIAVGSSPATAPEPAQPATTTVIYQTITQPVIERIIEASPGLALTQSGVTESVLTARLQELTTSMNARIQSAFLGAAQTARVENLSAITVSGVTGLTDADIPDGITASNYLPLTGGTLSGTLTGTNLTLSGDLTVSGAQTLSGAITIPYLTATSTTASSFIQASTTRLSVFDRAYFGGSATSTFDSAGNLSVAGTVTATSGLSTLSNLLLTGSTTLRDFTFGNATGTAATTTSFFSTTASTTNLFTSNFSVGSLTGFLKATAGAVATALIDLASDVTGILPASNGGTGWSNIVSGTLLTGNGSNALSTTTVGNGLSLSGGVLSTSFGTTTVNAWSALQSFTLGASTTQLSALDALYIGRTATTTIRGDGIASILPYASTTALTVSGTGYFDTASTTNLTLSGTPSSILSANSSGVVAALSVGNGLTFSSNTLALAFGTTTGNTWTALQQFSAGASTTRFSIFSNAYFGGTATSTFDSTGALTLATPLLVSSGGTGAASFGQGWLHSSGGTNALTASTSPTVNYITATSTTATSTIGTGGFTVGGSYLVVQQGSGNVGLGTTSPSHKLSIEGTNPLVSFYDTDDNQQFHMGYANDLGSGAFTIAETGVADRFVISQTTGNVGIGSTTPNSLLTLSGTAAVLKIEDTFGGNPSLVLTPASGESYTFIRNATTGFLDQIGAQTSFSGFTWQVNNGTEVMRINNSGLVGIATTSPWRTLSVTGTVGFDGLTGSTGAGSLCLDANKQLTYNSASDACLSSTRATKHDIASLDLDGIAAVLALDPVSFIYNAGDGRTRFGFIAEDTAAVLAPLATYNASSSISGIDDRAILSVVVKAIKDLIARIAQLFDNDARHDAELKALKARVSELEAKAGIQSTAPEVAAEPPTLEESELAEPPPPDVQLAEEQEEAATPPTSDQSAQAEAVEDSTESVANGWPAEAEGDPEADITSELPEADAPPIAPAEAPAVDIDLPTDSDSPGHQQALEQSAVE